MTATILLILSLVVLLLSAFGVGTPHVQGLPLGAALAVGAWLALRLGLP